MSETFEKEITFPIGTEEIFFGNFNIQETRLNAHFILDSNDAPITAEFLQGNNEEDDSSLMTPILDDKEDPITQSDDVDYLVLIDSFNGTKGVVKVTSASTTGTLKIRVVV